jgi:hypothetical protein
VQTWRATRGGQTVGLIVFNIGSCMSGGGELANGAWLDDAIDATETGNDGGVAVFHPTTPSPTTKAWATESQTALAMHFAVSEELRGGWGGPVYLL